MLVRRIVKVMTGKKNANKNKKSKIDINAFYILQAGNAKKAINTQDIRNYAKPACEGKK